MKTNTKTKKSIATKSKPVAKVTKNTAKNAAKKPVAKSVVKSVVKPVTKSVVKKITPAVKTKSTSVAKVAIAKKLAPKANKIAVKKVKPLIQAKKAPTKPVKAVKTAPKIEKLVVSVKKQAEKPVSKIQASKAIVVKMPENQNTPIRASVMTAIRPVMVSTKVSMNTVLSPAQAARPAYRPIQVINKPLTPLQPVRQMAPVTKESEKIEFKKGDYVVYPAHGVGEIEAVETQIIGGMEIKLYAIAFEKDRMKLKVPVFKAHASGLRRLSNANRMDDALKTLQGRAQVRRAMWSRRAQEYETKINSGDPVSIAEVLRDLKRSNDESEQSYSERQIYQSALERLAREVAAVEKITEVEAAERLEGMIKSKRARAAAHSAAEELVKEAANG